MNHLHDLLDAFADGELEVDDAERFRRHLGTCAECQARLADALQLRSLEHSMRTAPSAAARGSGWRDLAASLSRRGAMLVGAGLAASVTAALVLWPAPAPPDLFAEVASRPVEARLSWVGARAYRPYEVLRSSERRPSLAVPLRLLAGLEARDDQHGLGVGHLLRGELDEAASLLEQGAEQADRLSDRAVVALEQGRPEEALPLLDRALELSPEHPQARWNLGLALQALFLDASAAEAFSSVARLAEPGWAEEASVRAEALRRTAESASSRWLEAWQAGIDLALDGTPMPLPLALAAPSMARSYLYQAVWAAPSAERVRALLPLASALDQGSREPRLSAYVAEIAGRDFSRRGPLAERFAEILTGYLERLRKQGTPLRVPSSRAAFDFAHAERYLEAIAQSGEDDLFLGAIPLLGQLAQRLDVYQEAAAARGDPFFLANVLLERARQEEAAGRLARAEAQLLEALQRCGSEADYRRLQTELRLSQLYLREHRVGEAREHALVGLRLARAQHEPSFEGALLHVLADHARFTNAAALARAYLSEEGRRKPDDRALQSLLHEERAMLALLASRPAEARAELDRVDGVLSLVGALALADVAKLDPRPDDLARLRPALEALRAAPHTPGRGLLLDHIEAKTLLAKDRRLGEEGLRRVISEALRTAPNELDGQKARAYSYSALLLAAGEAQRYDEALSLFAEEARGPAPARCALGIELNDAQLLVAARGVDGLAAGEYRARWPSGGVDPAALVPRAILDRLRACPKVDVFARNGLHGEAELLPPDLAWSFVSGASRPAPASSEVRQLIISDVEAPPSLKLARLRSWQGPGLPGRVELRGAAATPRSVLGAIAAASEVQFHAHGLVNLGTSEASLLVLSPDAAGDYALTAQQVRGARLSGAPVVVLAACKASQSFSPSLAAPWSLPVAFLEAGARAVLASSSDIPDADSGAFFEAVLVRIRRGDPPATALRDERVARLRADPHSWVRSVVVFEVQQVNSKGEAE